jgi:cation transport ATPase
MIGIKNKKGQVIIINIIFLVMTIVVFVAMIPVLRETINGARDQDSMNCKSCGTTSASCYYNSSKNTESVACAMIDLYVPYIVIVVLIAGVAKLLSNRVDSFMSPQQQQMPYGY